MARETNPKKINRVYVVGTVQEVSVQPSTSNSGRDYIRGKIVIKVVDKDIENLVEMKVLSFAKKSDGTDNPFYANYTKLDAWLGKRVKASGDLRDESMVDQSSGSVRHFNAIYLGFINPAKSDDMDQATFEFSGFVVKSLYERKNREDQLLGYRIEVGQANYNDTNMQVLRFDVHKDDITIAQTMEQYYVSGSTVSFSGTISAITRVQTKTEEVAFGEPIVKTFVAVDKMYRITGGNAPVDEDSPAAYNGTEIKTLIKAYKEADVQRIAAQSAPADDEPTTGASAMRNLTRSSSLL